MPTSEAEYQQQITALQERLHLQELIADISAIFVNLPVSEVDGQIERGLKRIVEFLDIDRSGFGEFSEDLKEFRTTHSSQKPEIEPTPKVVWTDRLPWYAAKLHCGEIVKMERPEDLPEEAAAEKAYCQQIGLKSQLSIPVAIGGALFCGIGFASFRVYRSWPPELVEQLERVAEVFGHAIYRKRAEQRMESQYRFEKLVSELSARFVKIHSDRVDDEIKVALQRLLEFLQVDRCGLMQISPDRNEVKLTHACHAEGIAQMPDTINYKEFYPWCLAKVLSGETVSMHVKDLPPEAAIDRRNAGQMGTRSLLLIPVTVNDAGGYILAIKSVRCERVWPEELLSRVSLIGEIFINALERRRSEEELRRSYREIKQLKDRLQLEADYLHEEIKVSHRHGGIVGQSEAMQRVLRQVEQVAPTDSSVLIQGETGVGKELVAHAIHNLSSRQHRVMVKVNCASLPATLVESELFGREKGAYTGALNQQAGRFQVADGSTIFLDEIGELSLELQAKLLRVLHSGEFERLGSTKTIKVNVRVIAATNRDLAAEVEKGRFREDLYYRLNVFPIEVPPLRERLADIPELVWTFVEEYGKRMGKKIQKISKRTVEDLQRYSWPGNIRELRNVIERAMIINTGSTLSVQIPLTKEVASVHTLTMAEMEAKHITEVLEKTGWRIKGENGAAAILGLNPSTLYSRIEKLGIPLKRKKFD